MRDELVPYQHIDQLYNTAKASIYKRKYVIDLGDHNSNWTIDPESYFKEIKDFIYNDK